MTKHINIDGYLVPLAVQRHYLGALQSQNASNPSGLILSFSQVAGDLWEELGLNNCRGTAEFSRHPIVRLYLEQINFLCGLTTEEGPTCLKYSEAYRLCELRGNATLAMSEGA